MNNWLYDIIYNSNKAIFYLAIHLANNIQEFFVMNNETVIKGIREDFGKWRDIPCSEDLMLCSIIFPD